MNLISHAILGIITTILLANTLTLPLTMTFQLIIFIILLSIIPDLDGLFAKKLSNHHNSPMHKPIYWIIISLIFIIFLNKNQYYIVILGLLLVLIHLITDVIFARSSGIKLFSPFSEKSFHLCKLNENSGNFKPTDIKQYFTKKHIMNYYKNKTLFFAELLLNTIGLIIIIGL